MYFAVSGSVKSRKRIALPVELTVADRLWLEQPVQSALPPRRLAERCRIVLLAAAGQRHEQIAVAPSYSANKGRSLAHAFCEDRSSRH
jgi:hypothetical protein